ncbi:MAG: hypothetical protein HZA49_09165 [Planctomycetes bacterium]|nr:hypothetical protein [Planctomycetota bacterium]
MKSTSNIKCPGCNSEDFVSGPNRYDLLKFVSGNFEVAKSELIDEERRVFCRECGNEIDEKISAENKRVVFKGTK